MMERSPSVRTPALFLDRDGVINIDRGYIHRIEDIEFLPGIFELARFAAQGLKWPIVVVSNQSGIGRGLFDQAAYDMLTEWMRARFRQEGAPLARVYHCPFHPEHGLGDYRRDHHWRKPQPGMLLQAATDLHLDLSASVLIGDSPSDIQAAAAAGVPFRIRLDPSGQPASSGAPDHVVVRDLAEALILLQARLEPEGGIR